MQKDVSLRLSPEKAFDNESIRKALHISSSEKFLIIRRSIDARRKDVVIDLACRINPENEKYKEIELKDCSEAKNQAIIVGSGPSGLFAALTLLENGIRPIIIERGKDVHSRRIDIAKISTQGDVNPNSNYSFGEGGAGTYSDGKLFTRSKKRGDNTKVLETFVQFGASEEILYDAHPHIGTDKLPKIIENIRNAIVAHGGKVLFNTKAVSLVKERGKCIGVIAKNLETGEKSEFIGDVILAIGNAARDTFKMLAESDVKIEAKGIAVGVRLEHPQHLIDQIQYHNPDGRGKFLPAAEYSFATQVTTENGSTGVYSFCMCPGGFVVPAASDSNQVVVNGMSPSTRGSVWANSGIVVELPVSVIGTEEQAAANPLIVSDFQQALEIKTFNACGNSQKAPSQRMADFIENRFSQNLPKSSYAPGLTPFNMRDVLPPFISNALCAGFKTFSRQAYGFMTNEAVLIGTETRTSSPIRITRDSETLESVSTEGLYPCGEGAGYAGGIVSAAIDGIRCAEKITAKLQM